MQYSQAASMDSVFLKSDFEGQRITLCIKDDNKKILLIAAVIVDKEDENNYTYFLSNCMWSSAVASTFNSPDMTIFTDGHKGSRPSLVACCPEAQTRRCLQHYIRNAPPPIGSVSVEFDNGTIIAAVFSHTAYECHDLVEKSSLSCYDVAP